MNFKNYVTKTLQRAKSGVLYNQLCTLPPAGFENQNIFLFFFSESFKLNLVGSCIKLQDCGEAFPFLFQSKIKMPDRIYRVSVALFLYLHNQFRKIKSFGVIGLKNHQTCRRG